MLPSTVDAIEWRDAFQLDRASTPRRVTLRAESAAEANAAIDALLATARRTDQFKCLRGWRDEKYRILGARQDVRVERAAASIFGIATIGVHMTVYTRDAAAGGQPRLWIPQRSATTTTNPGMLDNSVAGGVPAGVAPWDILVQEAADEASLPRELTGQKAIPVGCVTEFNIKDNGRGLLQPSVKYVYDMEVDATVQLRPADSEVEAFRLLTVDEAKAELLQGKFKPMSAFVMIDFFLRHGVLTPQNEKDYVELVARTHRRLPLATTP